MFAIPAGGAGRPGPRRADAGRGGGAHGARLAGMATAPEAREMAPGRTLDRPPRRWRQIPRSRPRSPASPPAAAASSPASCAMSAPASPRNGPWPRARRGFAPSSNGAGRAADGGTPLRRASSAAMPIIETPACAIPCCIRRTPTATAMGTPSTPTAAARRQEYPPARMVPAGEETPSPGRTTGRGDGDAGLDADHGPAGARCGRQAWRRRRRRWTWMRRAAARRRWR